MPPRFTLGLDLGQLRDHSAACALERVPAAGPDAFHVRHIVRWPLGTPYPAVVDAVAALLARPPLAGDVQLALDRSGVGVAVADLFDRRRLGCPVHGVMITAGSRAHREGRVAYVPKQDLIAGAQVALQQGRLAIAPTLPEAATLVRELKDYRYEVGAGGRVSFDVAAPWRQNQHDDVLLAACVGLWVAEHVKPAGLQWI